VQFDDRLLVNLFVMGRVYDVESNLLEKRVKSQELLDRFGHQVGSSKQMNHRVL
jgi:hypothetical protein